MLNDRLHRTPIRHALETISASICPRSCGTQASELLSSRDSICVHVLHDKSIVGKAQSSRLGRLREAGQDVHPSTHASPMLWACPYLSERFVVKSQEYNTLKLPTTTLVHWVSVRNRCRVHQDDTLRSLWLRPNPVYH